MLEALLMVGSVLPTYTVTTNKTTYNEGERVTVTINIENARIGDVIYYRFLTTTGVVTASDFTGGAIAGTMVVTGPTMTFWRDILADNFTEGTERFKVEIRDKTVSGKLLAETGNITINDTSLTRTYNLTPSRTGNVPEGTTIGFTVNTTNVPNGTVLYWVIAGGVTASDFSGHGLTGTVTINNNVGTFNVVIAEDGVAEGIETFTVSLRLTAAGTNIVTSPTFTIPTSTSITEYQRFLNWTNQYADYTSSSAVGSRYKSVPGGASTMWGSSYMANFTNDSNGRRIAQHAVPNATISNDNISNSRPVVFLVVAGTSTASYSSLTRNGYTSNSYGSWSGSRRVTLAIFWDNALQKARQWNPNTNGAISDFIF